MARKRSSPRRRKSVREIDHSSHGTCSFNVLIDASELGEDHALMRLAQMIPAAHISEDLDIDLLARGLLAIAIGGLEVEADDHRLLEKGSFVFEALYALSGLERDA